MSLTAPPATEPLRAEAVGVDADGRRLLQPTTLRVAPGELVALIGPSGSGKTTLLRVLAGVSDPSTGRVLLGDDHVSARSTDVGYLPVGDTVHPQLTVREALGYTALLRLPVDLTAAERDARVEEILAELRLVDRADTRIADLSNGERKRAACAVELIGHPAVLLLDEPASGLDPGLERLLMRMLRRIADQGRGVVVVTHATSSLALCDTVAVMAPGGRLAFTGTPDAALAAFAVPAFDQIYDALDGGAEEVAAELAALPPAPGRERTLVAGAFGRQTRVLAERYARCLLRERRTLRVLGLQAPVIGLCIGLVLPRDVLGNAGLASFYAVLLTFLLVTGSVWLGTTSSCREVVKERVIVEREAAAGVRLDAYLVAKVLVLFVLSAVQVAVLLAVVVALQPLHAAPRAYLQVFGLCLLAAWVSVAVGLTLSARVRSADQASSAVPLLLLPQLLFAGAIIPVGVMPAPVQALSVLTYSRWALVGGGNALGLDETLSGDASAVAGYERSFFAQPPAVAAAALLLFLIVLLACAGASLNRRTTTA